MSSLMHYFSIFCSVWTAKEIIYFTIYLFTSIRPVTWRMHRHAQTTLASKVKLQSTHIRLKFITVELNIWHSFLAAFHFQILKEVDTETGFSHFLYLTFDEINCFSVYFLDLIVKYFKTIYQ